MEDFNFTELYRMCKSQDWYDTASEIEVLKGYFSKVDNWRDVIKKNKRVKKTFR